VTKNLWRLVYNEAMWGKVMKSKYVEGRNMENWLQKRKDINKCFHRLEIFHRGVSTAREVDCMDDRK
jgi:hypothetical protein